MECKWVVSRNEMIDVAKIVFVNFAKSRAFTKVESIVIAGNEIVVSYFLSFNKKNGVVSFVQEDDEVIFVDCSKIDAIRIGKVCSCKTKVKFIEEDFSLLGNVCPQCLTEGSTLFFDFHNSELNLSLQAKQLMHLVVLSL